MIKAMKAKKSFSHNEMVIRRNYLLKQVADRTRQAHEENRYKWTPEEAKEIHSMIDEAEEIRLKIRDIERGK